MKFTIFQQSRLGQRSSNQDRAAYCYSRDALLMVVADGMGGHLHGEAAAQIAVQYIAERFRQQARPQLIDPRQFLSQTLLYAHHAILDYAFDKNLDDAPRTTVVACVVQLGRAWWAHVGDSRLYFLRGGRVLTRTRDHSQVQRMLDEGLIDEAQAATHPQRNRIYNCLGSVHPPRIELSREHPLYDGDMLALCTDGAWGPFNDAQLADLLCREGPLQGVPQLLDEAERLSGAQCDNLTMLAVAWHDENSPPPSAMTISTLDMGEQDVATQLAPFSSAPASASLDRFSDDEIERAIAEINAAIRKFSR